MRAKELCYKIEVIPDLSLNKYSSLDGNGVEGVLEKHLAFLRQWNRKGALSGTSIHITITMAKRKMEHMPSVQKVANSKYFLPFVAKRKN